MAGGAHSAVVGKCGVFTFGRGGEGQLGHGGEGDELVPRLVQGLASGNVPVARSYMADITDSTNEAQAFALLGAIFGLGGVAGPWIAGVLAFPGEKYPSIFPADGLFASRPFLLPCSAIAAVAALDACVAYVFLSESAPTTGTNTTEKATASSKDRKDAPVSVMGSSLFQLVCLTFGLFAVAYFAFNDSFAVWARTPPPLGGLGLSTTTIGTIQGRQGLRI